MRRKCLAVLIVPFSAMAIGLGTSAMGQFVGTVDGENAKGTGFLLYGAGLGNLYNAQAESIHVDTMMRLNEYIYESIRIDWAYKAKIRAQIKEKTLGNYNKIHDRILNDPNRSDLMSGNALNILYDELSGPKFSGSAYRLNSFKLDAGLVRKIPFMHAESRATLAMSRLKRWPAALRGPDLARERRNYEQTLDRVLSLILEEKTTVEPLLALGKSIDDLEFRLNEVLPPQNDQLYKDAKLYIKELKQSHETMKSVAMEKIIGEMDRYAGTTVYDLVEFMRNNKLQFAVPQLVDERKAYPKIYAALREQLDELKDAVGQNNQAPLRAADAQAPNP